MTNYLEQLVKSLTNEEQAALSTLGLPPGERYYLDCVLARVREPKGMPGVQTAARSASYGYKLRSLIISAILTKLGGSSELSQLEFLRAKRMRPLFLRRLPIVEARIQACTDPNAREHAYRRLFQLTLPWEVGEFDETLLRTYARKYADARVVPLPDESLFVEAQLLLSRIKKCNYNTDVQTELIGKLEALRLSLVSSPHIQASVTVLRALFEGYLYRNYNRVRAAEVNEALSKLVEDHPELYTSRHVWILRLARARLHLLCGEVDQAYALAHQLYSPECIHQPGHGVHELMYVESCIYTNHLEEAEQLLEQARDRRGILGVLHHADLEVSVILFRMFRGEYRTALDRIANCFRTDQETEFSWYQRVLFRCFEVVCYSLIGDYQYAEQLIRRHIKFCEYNSKRLPSKQMLQFLRLSQAIIHEVQGLRRLRRSHLATLESFRETPETEEGYALYLLLQRMRRIDRVTPIATTSHSTP